ncbi:hypothetical protein [Salininema proteolyticum]|uniref:Uncharacterized protein n=1 Tax=Salininema proteolyticum TaxID=1607685 RepID=A0ABV8TTY6_9ACTN
MTTDQIEKKRTAARDNDSDKTGRLIDEDGDGVIDGIDLTGDGRADRKVDLSASTAKADDLTRVTGDDDGFMDSEPEEQM